MNPVPIDSDNGLSPIRHQAIIKYNKTDNDNDDNNHDDVNNNDDNNINHNYARNNNSNNNSNNNDTDDDDDDDDNDDDDDYHDDYDDDDEDDDDDDDDNFMDRKHIQVTMNCYHLILNKSYVFIKWFQFKKHITFVRSEHCSLNDFPAYGGSTWPIKKYFLLSTVCIRV